MRISWDAAHRTVDLGNDAVVEACFSSWAVATTTMNELALQMNIFYYTQQWNRKSNECGAGVDP